MRRKRRPGGRSPRPVALSSFLSPAISAAGRPDLSLSLALFPSSGWSIEVGQPPATGEAGAEGYAYAGIGGELSSPSSAGGVRMAEGEGAGGLSGKRSWNHLICLDSSDNYSSDSTQSDLKVSSLSRKNLVNLICLDF